MANPVKMQAIVQEVVDYGAGTYMVVLKPSGKIPRFQPGQFLHLSIDSYDPAGGFWPDSRVFSIASSAEAGSISIVYSVKGNYTKKMAAVLTPGLRVWLKLPYGDFVINKHIKEGQDLVLVAGGTGISPFVPYLSKEIYEGNSARTILLHYGVRNASQLLFPEIIKDCANVITSFSGTIWVEDEAMVESISSRIFLKGGRLSIEEVYRSSKLLRDPLFFISGPPLMIRAFKKYLFNMGVRELNIRIDEWQ